MPIVSGGGGGGPATGTYDPVGSQTGVTLDTTTYADVIRGAGAKLRTLVFATDGAVLAAALTGDAFPRFVLDADPTNFGLALGNGAVDPLGANGAEVYWRANNVLGVAGSVAPNPATAADQAPTLVQISPRFTITSGALPTVALVSGTGAQIVTTRDVETVTPFTGDGTNNAATCAIALSPDNLTYSTVATISIAAALNLTGVLTDTVNARVPAGWYLKLTAVHGTLGTTTYY